MSESLRRIHTGCALEDNLHLAKIPCHFFLDLAVVSPVQFAWVVVVGYLLRRLVISDQLQQQLFSRPGQLLDRPGLAAPKQERHAADCVVCAAPSGRSELWVGLLRGVGHKADQTQII
jgi:hypothetical protein